MLTALSMNDRQRDGQTDLSGWQKTESLELPEYVPVPRGLFCEGRIGLSNNTPTPSPVMRAAVESGEHGEVVISAGLWSLCRESVKQLGLTQ